MTDGQRALEFLKELLIKLDFKAEASLAEESEDKISLAVDSNGASFLIGYRGEMLDAVSVLVSGVANKGREKYIRTHVDTENYRLRREKTLISLAERVAEKAVKTGRKQSLEPMNPAERRIIHAALTENKDVKTESEGEDPHRHIVIIPNNLGKVFHKRDEIPERKQFNREKRDVRPSTLGTGFGTFLGNAFSDSENKDQE